MLLGNIYHAPTFLWSNTMRYRPVFPSLLGKLNRLLLLLTMATCAAAELPPASKDTPIKITASFSVLADICAQIGGDQVQVQTLADWDQDSHMFTPQPEHLKTLLGSDLLVSSGLGLESWLPRMIRTVNYRGQQFIAGTHVQTIRTDEAHAHGEHDDHDNHNDEVGWIDPHWWDSLIEMRKVVAALVPVLEALRPQAGTYFQARAEQYQARLDALQREAEVLMARIPASQRYLIVPHNAFSYLARDFGLQTRSLQGFSTAEQASSQNMVALVKLIREVSVPAIFTETTTDARLIAQIQKETGVPIGGALISGALSRTLAPDYLAMMRYNLMLIAAGLGVQKQ
jgi:zinc/manganese transport system substrate-binding protein